MKHRILAALMAGLLAASLGVTAFATELTQEPAAEEAVVEEAAAAEEAAPAEEAAEEEPVAEEAAAEEPAAEEAAAEEVAAEEEAVETIVRCTTAYGDVEGIDNGTTQVFYGIPYAAAPVDELRWQAPVAPKAWKKALDCTKPHEMALQFVNDSETGERIGSGSEDCLNLDVYTTPDAENLPVLVYVHGGNNQTGNSQEIEGNEIVVRDDCVYVSLSYRLGLHGFNCLPALMTEEDATGNFTLLDIAFALDWVKENIAAFGGDPENITISGFSAGGRDVMAMLISPLFEGKFQKAIAFSGGMTTADPAMSQEQIASFLAPLAVEDGILDDEEAAAEWLLTDGEDVRDYLYSIESDRLAAAVGGADIRMAAFPHLYEDGVVLPEDGFDTEEYFAVPVIMLTGSTEFSFFNNFSGYYYSPEWTEYDEDTQKAGVHFGNIYGSDMYRIFNTQMSAEKMYENYDAPIYCCQVDFGSEASAVQLPMDFGAFHGIFVPMLADTNGYTGLYDFPSAAGYQAMGAEFNAYLKNFLATGDPNGKGLVEWPEWEPEEKLTQVFDADEEEATVEAKNVFKTYDEIMDEMEADETVEDEVKAKVIANSMNGRWFSDAVDSRYETASLWVADKAEEAEDEEAEAEEPAAEEAEAEEESESMLLGGWTNAEDPAVTDELAEAFAAAMEEEKVVYAPVALLGTQVVAGTNYCVLGQNEDGEFALVYLYVDLKGNAEVTEIRDFEY